LRRAGPRFGKAFVGDRGSSAVLYEDDGWVPRSLATVLRDIGGIQFLVGLLTLVPALVGVLYREWWAAASLVAGGAVTALVGAGFYWALREAPEPKRRHAMVTAGGGWLSIAVFGALPTSSPRTSRPTPSSPRTCPRARLTRRACTRSRTRCTRSSRA